MVTIRLYHDSADLAFDATAIDHDGEPTRVILDRTCFYPTSGGQPHDTGRLGDTNVIDVIDDDHKGLIDIINRVLEAEREGTSVKWALGELAAYANDHFTREEKMMEAANYPDLAAHKKTHKAFVEWLQSLRTVYGADPGAVAFDACSAARARNSAVFTVPCGQPSICATSPTERSS